MARGYFLTGPNATGTALKTGITVIGATVRPRIFDAIFGSNATPGDTSAQHAITRFTAAGTTAASPPTPTALDPGDTASVSTAGWTHSAEPTYAATGSNLFLIDLNQRATFRYVASPGYELVAPATAANGLGARMVAATASLIFDYSIYFYE